MAKEPVTEDSCRFETEPHQSGYMDLRALPCSGSAESE